MGLKEASLHQNGWVKFPSGLILQWMTSSINIQGGGTEEINFPIAFPNNVLNVSVSTKSAGSPDCWIQILEFNSQVVSLFHNVSYNPAVGYTRALVFAIGH